MPLILCARGRRHGNGLFPPVIREQLFENSSICLPSLKQPFGLLIPKKFSLLFKLAHSFLQGFVLNEYSLKDGGQAKVW